jgi:hypothetical protein
MKPRIPTFCLTLLIVLSAGAAASGGPTSGKIPLTLLPVSSLPLDVKGLAESLCGPSVLGPGLAKCPLKVGGSITTTLGGYEETGIPSIKATDLSIEGTPVTSSCGTWSVSLSLDPAGPQLESVVVLAVAGGDPTHGLLASVLAVRVRLRLVNLRTGQVFDEVMRIGLGLAGPWSLASSAGATDPAMSNLLPFPEGNCGPVWLLEASNRVKQFWSGDDCEVCLSTALPASPGGVAQ